VKTPNTAAARAFLKVAHDKKDRLSELKPMVFISDPAHVKALMLEGVNAQLNAIDLILDDLEKGEPGT
jgi:hypothetical protein